MSVLIAEIRVLGGTQSLLFRADAYINTSHDLPITADLSLGNALDLLILCNLDEMLGKYAVLRKFLVVRNLRISNLLVGHELISQLLPLQAQLFDVFP